MKNYIKISCLIFFPCLLLAQGGLLNQGAKIKITANAKVKILNGGVSNQANGEILNTGTVYLDNDWVQTGINTAYLGTGWISFEGTSNQKISSASPLTISNLRVNNNNRLILKNDVSIDYQLDLSNNGRIELGNNHLIMYSSAFINNYDAKHYIITNGTGSLQQEVAATKVIFPIGNASYNPVTIKNEGTIDNFRARVKNQAQQINAITITETENMVNRTWVIGEETIGGSLAAVTLQWETNQEQKNFSHDQSLITQGEDIDGSNSKNLSPVINNGSHWAQTRTELTSFSSFVVRNINARTIASNSSKTNLEQLSNVNIQVFPSPTENYLNIRLQEDTDQAFIQLFDSKGSLVLQTIKTVGPNLLIQLDNIGNLIDGIYSIRIVDDSNRTFSEQFVKSQQ